MAPPKPKRQKLQYDPIAEARLQQVAFKDSDDLIKNLYKDGKSDIEIRDITEVEDSEITEDTKEHDSDEDKESDEEHDSDKDKGSDQEHDSNEDAESGEDTENDSDDGGKTDEDQESNSDDELKEEKPEITRAWFDADEENYSVKDALKIQRRRLPGGIPEKTYVESRENKFKSLHGTPNWAKIEQEKDKDSDDSDDEILKHSNRLRDKKGEKLASGVIEIKALTDINTETHNEGPTVTSLQFHPTSTVALVAGLSGVLSIFQVDGRNNNKLHSIRFERFRINSAKFLRDGSEIIAGTRNHPYCQLYDLMSDKICKIPLPDGVTNMEKFEVSPDGKYIAVIGRRGQIFLLSALTKELIHTFQMNTNDCRAITFTPDSKNLISHGNSQEMYVWDLNSRVCVHRPIDNGCITGTSIAVSPSGQFLASGSKEGVVNIYETSSVLREKSPKPSKRIENLVTSITSLKFNSTCEILAMGSKNLDNAFKLVHLPSFHVFSNFPTGRTTIYQPLEIDFSPSSGFLGISNNKGCAHLYRLKHYGNY